MRTTPPTSTRARTEIEQRGPSGRTLYEERGDRILRWFAPSSIYLTIVRFSPSILFSQRLLLQTALLRRSQSDLRHSFRTRRNRTTLIALLIRFPSLSPSLALYGRFSGGERERGRALACAKNVPGTGESRTYTAARDALVCPASTAHGVDSHLGRQAEEDGGNLVSADLFPGRIEVRAHSDGGSDASSGTTASLARSP